VSEKRSRSACGTSTVRVERPAAAPEPKIIFCSFEPSRRRRIAGLPASSMGLCT
jgi:hypothetical protein